MSVIFFAFLLSFLIAFVAFEPFIRFLQKQSANQPIYDLAPKMHSKKAKTVTMGGLVIVMAVLFSSVVFSFYLDFHSYIIIFTLITFSIIGFVDDYLKIKSGKNSALTSGAKFFAQSMLAALIVIFIAYFDKTDNLTILKITKNLCIDLNWFYYLFAAFIIVGSCNAVNLTDGLDGLAALSFLSALLPLLVISITSNLIQIYIPLLFILGACLAFLWFNAKPAQIFMGDTGSLALGGVFAVVGILLKVEFFLLFFGCVFVIETLSVILQVLYFKASKGKRLFKMAPIHHHFELLGVSEEKIVLRFFIVAMTTSALGFLLYKI